MSKAASENVESVLLTQKENKLVVHTLGKGKKSLATAVAQLYLALPSDRTHWSKLGAGVVCLVKDKQEKSFFIRFLDIKEKCVVWEQELYKQFKYRAVSKYFQTFFAHNCRAGINFASTEEAALFRAAIMERVNVFKRKRDEMRQRKLAAYQQQQQMNFQMNALQAMQNPYFRMQFMPPSMQSMMMMQMRAPAVAASQRAQLQAMFNSMSPETRQAFLMNMKSGGSMASMYGQPSMSGMLAGPAGRNSSNFAITSASQQVPHHPHTPPHAHHMKPSHETHSTFHPPPLEPSRPAPPVPVEPKSSAPLPAPPSTEAVPTAVPPPPGPATPPSPGPAAPPPPESSAVPPPGPAAPPPPPPGPAAPPPPPPPPAPSAPSTPSSPVSSGGITSSGSVDRGGLLQSIQAGTKLRKVGESTSSRKAIPKVESQSMRGALARALDNRAKVLGDEDSDDDDEWDDDDDDDWSD